MGATSGARVCGVAESQRQRSEPRVLMSTQQCAPLRFPLRLAVRVAASAIAPRFLLRRQQPSAPVTGARGGHSRPLRCSPSATRSATRSQWTLDAVAEGRMRMSDGSGAAQRGGRCACGSGQKGERQWSRRAALSRSPILQPAVGRVAVGRVGHCVSIAAGSSGPGRPLRKMNSARARLRCVASL